MPDAKNRRVLVIDDNESVREDFRKVLGTDSAAPAALSGARSAFLGQTETRNTLPTFELGMASQGEEGVQVARAARDAGRPFALAFVDVRMPPGLDGVQTIERLWQLQDDLQIVICTAFADYSFEEIIERLGASDNLLILKKPFEPVEVRQLACALTEKWNTVLREKERMQELFEAEREAREFAVSLADTNRALEDATRLSDAASRAKSEFLANMSHEIRTPMNAMLGYVDLLLDGLEPSPEQAEYVATIKRGGQHLLEIINDILDLSRVEAGGLAIESAEFSLRELLREVVHLTRPQALEKGLELVLETAQGVPTVLTNDATRIRQVLLNLLGNAVKFTRAGTVRLAVSLTGESGTSLRFDVHDTGPGIPNEKIPSLFDAFTQLDASTTRAAGGTGLGLTICKRFAEALGGRIEVESVVGVGSTFSFVLENATNRPATSPNDASAVRPGAPARGDEAPLACRVLLVEDVPVNQVLIATFLRKAACEVDVAENGLAGHRRAHEARDSGAPYDLILMDMQMPVMDGYRTTELLRSEGFTTPIVALTAHAMTTDREKCLAAGCSEYVAKPVDRRLLLETCRRVLAHTTPPALPASREHARREDPSRGTR